jgi:phage-related minor tail protein
MAVKLADAVAFLRTDDKELKSGLGAADAEVTGWAGKLSGAIGGAAVGIAAAAGAALVGATIAVGKAAWDMGQEYDSALDAIINGTGASGEALDAMGQSVRNLKTSSAGLGVSMEQIGATLAEVNTRTGATGSELETLTGRILQFSRLTGTDSVANVQLLTRTMGDWGVGMEDSNQLLDMMYGAGQAFGISVDSLAGKLVQFGAPLRQMGFSLEESAAMLGKWEKEGVNTELVIGSLRIAAGKFAKENIPLQDGLRQTMAAIKGAATESEGLAIAMDVFGARAGPDMAAAIREGRFELDEAIATLQGTQGSLASANVETLGFSERWEMSMAKMADALIPLGSKMEELGVRLMPLLVAAIESVIAVITPLIGWLVEGIDALTGVVAANDQVVGSFGAVAGSLESMFGPALQRAQELLGVVGAAARQFVDQNLNYFNGWIAQNMPRIQQIVSNVLTAITGFWSTHGATIVATVQRYLGWMMDFWSMIFRTLLNIVQVFLQVLTGDWEGAGQTLQAIVRDWWTTLQRIFSEMIASIVELWRSVDWGGIGRAIVDGIWAGLRAAWGGLQNWFGDRLQEWRNMLPFSEPKDPSSPLRGLAKAGEAIVEQVRLGIDRAAAWTLPDLRMPAVAGATVGAPMTITINISGVADAEGAGRASRDGVLAALRAKGLR